MSAVTCPQAPRAIAQQREPNPAATPLEAVFKDAMKRLYPRLALFEALAKFKDEHGRRQQSNQKICEARRDFLDSFAYLCDVEKGGATVTAAALRKVFRSNILWLAANEGVRWDIKQYAENILRKLKFVTPETQKAIQNDIFQLALDKSTDRIAYYRDEMQKYARNCINQLTQARRNDSTTSLQEMLEKLAGPLSGIKPADLVDLFYNVRGAAWRDRSSLQEISRTVGLGGEQVQTELRLHGNEWMRLGF